MMSLAQFESQAGNQSSSESQPQIEVPLNFTLKAKGGEKAKEGQENKTVTVDVNIQQGEGGNPTKVPVTAEVPNNTKMQDVQLCASMKEGKQSCQSLKDFMPKGESKSSSETSEKSEKGPGESNETSEESTNAS